MRTLRFLVGASVGAVILSLVAGPAQAADTQVQVPVIADTYTSASSPTSDNGTSASLGIYGSPAHTAVLRVTLPQAPVGQVLSGASLRVRTTSIASAGSTNQATIRAAADTWAEAGTLYANRPAVTGPVLGTLPGGTVPNTDYSISLDLAGFQDASGTARSGSFSLAVVGSGTDSLWLWSRDASPSLRPALQLTFSDAPGGTPPTDSTPPSAPGLPAAVVTGSSVALSWQPATDSVGVAGYTVHRASESGFTPASANAIQEVSSPGFVDSNRPVGTWYYRIVAFDAAGNRGPASGITAVQVAATPSNPPGQTVQVTVQATADSMAAAVNPTFAYGTLNQLSARGAPSTIESYLRFGIPSAPAGTQLTAAALNVRTSTDSTAASAGTHRVHLVSGAWNESSVTWNTRPTVAASEVGRIPGLPAVNAPFAISLNAAAIAERGGASVDLALLSDSADNVRLWSREAASAEFRPQLVLTFTGGAGPGPDTTPPTVPGQVVTTVTGSSVSVGWAASTDAIGVAGYSVHRSSDAGFTPGPATLVHQTTALAFTDSARPTGTWYYRVVAADAAGNRSVPSAAVAATVAAPTGPPVVVTVPVTADTFTGASAPTAENGTSASLGVYGTPAHTAVLRVALPESPAGQTLTGATLRVSTTTIPSAGSANAATVRFATDTWTETGTFYANRPTPSGAVLGTLAGGSVPSTNYSIPLTASAFGGRTGSTTLAIEGTGPDSLWLWSRQAQSAVRPVLQLTYQSGTVDPPPTGASVTVMAVGDIACEPGSAVTGNSCRHGEVAARVRAGNPDWFIGLGDLQYQQATLAQFMGAGAYNDTFGAVKAITLPVLGNHEYLNATNGYFDYFYGAGVSSGAYGSRPDGYYATNIGSWRFIGLNTECGSGGVTGGCGVGSPQYRWLQNELASHPTGCTIAAAHRPRFSTGASHGSYSAMSPLWDLMASNGVDVVLSGHNHVSEIFKPIGVSGAGATPNLTESGIRAFTAGGGGANIQQLSPSTDPLVSALEARSRLAFGPLKLTLSPEGYSWEFLPIQGMTFTNVGTTGSFSGSDSCN